MAIATSGAGRILKVVGSDEQRSHGGRLVPNHAETVAGSVLHQDIAGGKQHLRAIVKLDCQVAGDKDAELRRVRLHDEADATYGWECTGRRRIVPRVRVGCGLIGTPEEGELS